jgi:hypothetical protein
MSRKLLTIFVVFISIGIKCNAQKNKIFVYYLSKDLATVAKKNAVFYGEGVYENNLFELNCFTTNKKNILMTLRFTDSSLKNCNGLCTFYNEIGKRKEEGNYKLNKQNDVWKKWDITGKITDSIIYLDGNPIITSTFSYDKKGNLYSFTLKDSLNDTYHKETYVESLDFIEKVDFIGQKGIIWNKTKNGITIDTVFTREEIEEAFPGGLPNWSKYLQRNLNVNVVSDNRASSGTYNVIVRFTIEKDGTIKDIIAETNVGYGAENEVIRIIRDSPNWEPGIQYGRKVKSIKRQPITFVVARD